MQPSRYRLKKEAEEGLVLAIEYLGKTYLLKKAGDARGTKPEKPQE